MNTRIAEKWILFLFFGLAINGFAIDKKLVRIDLSGKSEPEIHRLLDQNLDITSLNKENNSIEALVGQDKLDLINALDFETSVKIPSTVAFDAQLRSTGYFDNFHSYEETLADMQAAEQNHPDIAQLVNLGNSWETEQGIAERYIWAIKISDNATIEEDEPEVLIMGCHHAREIITPEIVLAYMNLLLDSYGSDPYLTRLVDTRQIWLVPLVNPDGYTHVLTMDSWWRKNRRDNGDGSFGVDLNRNYSFQWGLFDNWYVNSTPSDDCYRGPEPFSEPELQAVKNLVESHNFITALSFHSYAQEILYPWGYQTSYTPDHNSFTALADSIITYNGYGHGTSWEVLNASYLTNGNSEDWFYGDTSTKNKVFQMTPEVGTSFHPDLEDVPGQISENMGPCIYVTYAAGEEPLIDITPLPDFEHNGPYPVTATVKSPILLTSPASIDPSGIFLYYSATGLAPFDSVQMTAAGNPNEYVGEIPGATGANTIYYFVSATDETNRTGLWPRGAPETAFSFSIGTDTEAPTISHTPVTRYSKFFNEFAISAFVSDNIGVAGVQLFYKKNDGVLDSLDMMLTGENQYKVGIFDENPRAGDYYDYKIVATDVAFTRNQVHLPENGFYRFYILNSLLYDFELDQSFTANNGDWQWGAPTVGPMQSHSGTRIWGTNLTGNYNDATESMLDMPELDLTGKDSTQLTFWHWYENEYSSDIFWDGGNVKIAVDSGDFQVITPVDGYDGIVDDYNTFLGGQPCFGGPATIGNFWHQETFDLSAYANQRVKIRFHFGSDQYTTTSGWYIDDVEILFKEQTTVQRDDVSADSPEKFHLAQNYPNPFNPNTHISFHIASPGNVRLNIYNVLGQHVKTLADDFRETGIHHVSWDGTNDLNKSVSSGIYIYQLSVETENLNRTFTRKMVKME